MTLKTFQKSRKIDPNWAGGLNPPSPSPPPLLNCDQSEDFVPEETQ